MSQLALFGGAPAVTKDPDDLFTWPIVTDQDEAAVLEVLRAGKMSSLDVTYEFEREIAEWHVIDHALAHNNGTSALHAAMFAVGLGSGDELIAPSLTFWASCLQAFNLGANVVFADVTPGTYTIDPGDVERRITDRTKAIMVVHYMGMPCDMDGIMTVAGRHDLKVIEDVSHAQGGLYKGQLVGTFSDVAAFSIMSEKSLVAGEGGMLITDDRLAYERAVAFGHYERTTKGTVTDPGLSQYVGLPLGGHKYRINQMASAMGRVQLRCYCDRMGEIQRATNYFWDLLEGVPGLEAHRPPKDSGSTMGGWYWPHGIYRPEELEGLPLERFVAAVRAEGVDTRVGANEPLHLHPVVHELRRSVLHGTPRGTQNENVSSDIESLPVTEAAAERLYHIPSFRKFDPQRIEEYAIAFEKVSENFRDLM